MPIFNNILAGAAGQAGGAAAAGPIKSVRFNAADTPELTRTPSSAGNTRKFTISFWAKRSKLGSIQMIGQTGDNYGNLFRFYWIADDSFVFHQYNGSSYVMSYTTSAKYRDPSAWYHYVISMDTTLATAADRARLYVNGVEVTDFSTENNPAQNLQTGWNAAIKQRIGREYTTTYGNYYNYDGYLADFYNIDGQQLDCTSFGEFDDNGVWQAKDASGLTFGTNGFHLFDFANESGIGNDSSGNDNDWTVNNISAVGADTVASVDSKTGGTYTDQQLLNSFWKDPTGGITYFSPAGLTAVVFNLSPALEVSDFKFINAGGSGTIKFIANEGESNETSASQAVSSSTALYDISSFDNLAISTLKVYIDDNSYPQPYGFYNGSARITGVVNGSLIDVLRDVPTNGDSSDDTGAGGEVSGNYATFNPLMATSEFTYANGNLETSFDAGDNNITVSTIAPKSGKWYAEIVFTASGVANNFYGEVAVADASKIGQGFDSSTSTRYREGSADIYGAGTATGTKSDFAVGDVMGVAVDADNDTVYFYKNNTLEGTVTSLGFDGYAIGVAGNSGTGRTFTAVANYGQRSWVYSAPSGYSPLCTALLPTPTIADGSDYFAAKTYSGTGATQSITTGFSPDLVWIKSRSSTDWHHLVDTVRGYDKYLFSNQTDAEYTATDRLTSFNSDGFTLGTNGNTNGSSATYVSWAWDAGSSTASNTDGSVTSQVRVNQTAGFSIVSWTSSSTSGNYDSIGHGLNALPGLVITKRRTVADSWYSAHGFDLTQFGKLNSTDAFSNAGAAWGSGITSSVIGMRVGNFVGANEAMIAYCFAPVAGYSAFGSYEGNGSNDGVFVHTGFSVRWLLTKASSHGSDWQLWDSARQSYNVNANTLTPNSSGAETGSAGYAVDLLSNGFKFRNYGSSSNQSGYTYIWAAFASNPFQANGGLAR